MTDCPNGDIRDLLPELLNGRLAPQARAKVEAHLQSCGDCRDELELLGGMRRSMHRAPAVAVADIVSVLPAYRAPTVRLGRGWRIAAALLLIAGGGTSIVVARNDRILGDDSARVAVTPVVPSGATAAVPVPAAGQPPVPVSHPSRGTAAPRELAVAITSVGDLTDAELDALVSDLGSLDAVTPPDVEQPAAISPIPPSSPSGAGA